jgi:hypothetical protein
MHFYSIARYDLGLSAEEFFDLTPRQFDALLKRHRYRVESTEFLFAQLTSWIANTGFRSTEKPTADFDFMPSQWMKKAKKKAASASDPKKPVRMTKKKRHHMMLRFTEAFAGARVKKA